VPSNAIDCQIGKRISVGGQILIGCWQYGTIVLVLRSMYRVVLGEWSIGEEGYSSRVLEA